MIVKILTGEDVTNVYKYPSSYTESSMTGERLGEFTRIYEDNPDKVGMVVCYNKKNEITARGLLWTCDNGVKVIDGIYGTQMGTQEIFEWVYENKIISIYDIVFKHNAKKHKITLNINRDTVPFMDTFCYGIFDETNMKVILSCVPTKKTNIAFTSHEGYCYTYSHIRSKSTKEN